MYPLHFDILEYFIENVHYLYEGRIQTVLTECLWRLKNNSKKNFTIIGISAVAATSWLMPKNHRGNCDDEFWYL